MQLPESGAGVDQNPCYVGWSVMQLPLGHASSRTNPNNVHPLVHPATLGWTHCSALLAVLWGK